MAPAFPRRRRTREPAGGASAAGAGSPSAARGTAPAPGDGVEIRHPSHSAEDIRRLTALAEFLSLVPSGGSDWHGATKGGRVLGVMQVPMAWLEAQDERVAGVRAVEGGAGA